MSRERRIAGVRGEPFSHKYLKSPGPLETLCWIWMRSRQPSGYGSIRWRGESTHAHRVSWELHKGLIPAGLHVLHKCDDRACVNPAHLFLGTHVDNMRDMARKGRAVPSSIRGERHYAVKLTDAQVLALRGEHAAGVDCGTLGRKYGVTQRTAWAMAHGHKRSYLPNICACRH